MKFSLVAFICLFSISAFAQRTPEERKILFQEAGQRLRDSKMEDKVPKVGDTFPDLNLIGKKVSDYLKEGPLVVTFYRGGWCPYCVKQLKEINSSIQALTNGANLVALSPEAESEVQKTKRKNGLNFTLLSDADNKFSRQLNLTFKVESEVVKEYKALGIDLKASQGNESYELPMPATFVIGTDRKIAYVFADSDYTKRASTDDIVRVVKKLIKR